MLAVISTIAIFGVVLIALGWRGKRVSDAPHCANCRFDLSGLPKPIHNYQCPECGEGLGGPARVIHGRREKRWPMFLLGASCVLIPLSLVVGVFLSARSTLITKLPTRVVIWQTYAGVESTEAALDELIRRSATSQLRPTEFDALVDRAIARQAETSRVWFEQWGDIIEKAWQAGRLTDEQLRSYTEHAFEFETWIQPQIARGTAPMIRVKVDSNTVRMSSVPRLWVTFSPMVTGARLDGNPLTVAPIERFYSNLVTAKDPGLPSASIHGPGNAYGWALNHVEPDRTAFSSAVPSLDLDPGAYTLEVDLAFHFMDAEPDGRSVASIERTVTRDIEIVPKEHHVVERILDAGRAKQMAASVQIEQFVAGRAYTTVVRVDDADQIIGEPELVDHSFGRPQSCSFRMKYNFGRDAPRYTYRLELIDDRLDPIPLTMSTFAGRSEAIFTSHNDMVTLKGPRSGWRQYGFVDLPREIVGDTVTLVFRPDPEMHRRMLAIENWQMFDEPLMIENIPVTRPGDTP